MGDTGLEQPQISPEKTALSQPRGTESGTAPPQAAPTMPADLAQVIAAWPALPARLKAGILAMVLAV